MDITRGKIVALAIALAYLAVAIAAAGWDTGGIAAMCLCLSVPLAMIWFPDALGGMQGVTRGGWMNESPSVLISALGWFFLVAGLPAVAFLLSR